MRGAAILGAVDNLGDLLGASVIPLLVVFLVLVVLAGLLRALRRALVLAGVAVLVAATAVMLGYVPFSA